MSGYAQQNLVLKGNKLYDEKKYKEAASVYQNALKKNPNYLPGIFNLGNALYQEKNYDASRKIFDAAAKKSIDPKVKSSSDYNVGNTYMSEQKWEDAVNAYKQALRKNPQDEDAKYNLSYALAKMKQNQGGGGKNNDKNKDQNKDKQNQDQNNKNQNKDQNKDSQDNKDKQDQNKDQQDQGKDKQDQNKDEQQDQKPQPQPSKLSEKQADQLLNALSQEEKKLHDKKEKGKAVKVKVDKDW